MALNSVETLFVAWSIVNERLVEPPAALYGRVLANQVVSLSFQQLSEFVGNQGRQGRVTSGSRDIRIFMTN